MSCQAVVENLPPVKSVVLSALTIFSLLSILPVFAALSVIVVLIAFAVTLAASFIIESVMVVFSFSVGPVLGFSFSLNFHGGG